MKKRKTPLVEAVKRKTLSEEVIDHIIQLLIDGTLKPGDKLPSEVELSEMLSVSRPVLREAMSSLDSLGMIHRKTRGGTYFSKKIGSRPFSIMLALSAGDIVEIVESRMALELGLVTLAAENITAEELDTLSQTIEKMSVKQKGYTKYDREFHRIIALSGSRTIFEGMVDAILTAFDKTLSEIKEKEHETTLKHHRNIYQALKKRSPMEAFTHMYEHMNFVRHRILTAFHKNTGESE